MYGDVAEGTTRELNSEKQSLEVNKRKDVDGNFGRKTKHFFGGNKWAKHSTFLSIQKKANSFAR
nr:hypothetical protein MarFTME_285 [Marseillevirus futianmevirus]